MRSRESGPVFSYLSGPRRRAHSDIAEPEEIPFRAVAVALYFIFMQKRQITFRRDAIRLADEKPASETFDPILESGETRAVGIGNVQHTRARSSLRYIFSVPLLPFLAFLFAK